MDVLFGNVTYEVVSTIAGGLAYCMAWVLGVFVSVEAWFISIVLQINANVMQTSFVQTGFSISLSVANLAFVLGIIVIALATILRIESYSIKKMLWKLVVMAILVNFGLVIMAPIFAFSNSLTQYFLNCVTPSGCSGTATGIASFNSFANNFSGQFNPQRIFAAANQIDPGAGTAPAFSFGGKSYSPVGAAMVPIFSLLFSAIDFMLIVFVLGAFIIILMIRYVYIAILAILLPFAWTAWVFPSFGSLYSKWWNKFLQWTFFAPIFMFFLYLAMTTMGGSNNADAFNLSNSGIAALTTSSDNFTVITAIIGAQIGPILQNFLQEIVLTSLILGGLFAADSMGVKFAGAAIKTAQNTGKAVQGYVGGYIGNQSKKAGRAAFRKVGGDKAIAAMRNGTVGNSLGVVGRIPLVGAGAKWAVSRGASLAGRAVEPHLSNKDLVDEAKKKVPENMKTVEENLKGNMNMETTFAHLSKLIEKGKITKDTKVGQQSVADFLDSHRSEVSAYGFTKSAGDADKMLMSTIDSRNAERARTMGVATAAVENDIKDENGNIIYKKGSEAPVDGLQQAAEAQLYRDNPKTDFSKADVNNIFGKDVNQQELVRKIRNIAENGPTIVPVLLKNMKGPTLERFTKEYKNEVDRLVNEAKIQEGVASLNKADEGALADAKLRVHKMEEVQKAFDRSYSSVFGSAGEEGHGDGGHGGGGGGSGGGDKDEHK